MDNSMIGVSSTPELSSTPEDDHIYYINKLNNHNDCYLHGLYPPDLHQKLPHSEEMTSQIHKIRRQRRSIDAGDSIERIGSQIGGRPRAKSCSRFTPLGDERRASARGKKSSRNPRRNSSFEASHRKSSVRVKSIDSQQIKLKKLASEEVEETPEARRHRKIVGLILGTFVFLLTASVIVVIVTLTNRTFHTPPTGNQELIRHRAQQNQPLHRTEKTFRKENEELLNSLNRDTSVPENSTVASL